MALTFAIVRLGKESRSNILDLNGEDVGSQPYRFTFRSKQVPKEVQPGTIVFIVLGSDNGEGRATPWKQGLRAIGKVFSRVGDDWQQPTNLEIEVPLVLPFSIDRFDFLRDAPQAYYWFSRIPVFGLNVASQQAVQLIKPDHAQGMQSVEALLFAVSETYSSFRILGREMFPELEPFFHFVPASPQILASATSVHPPVNDLIPLQREAVNLPAEWILALCSTNFVIVSGLSGTGKSKTALDIARAVDYTLPDQWVMSRNQPANCASFVPVGADWMDSSPLFGYRNPFGPRRRRGGGSTGTTHEEFVIPDALLLILRAHLFPTRPHFLILDEMNLSHVERYFFPVLSLLEARKASPTAEQPGLLTPTDVRLLAETMGERGDRPAEYEVAKRMAEQHQGLSLPPNLFVVGTVNVDETTYMFSPKVLDRCHVLELSVPDVGRYMHQPSVTMGDVTAEDALRWFQAYIERNRSGHWHQTHPRILMERAAQVANLERQEADRVIGSVERLLEGLSILLTPVGFGLGYRPINDFVTYICAYLESGSPGVFAEGWVEAMDRAVLQRLLPKLHGNRHHLAGCLSAVYSYLTGEFRNASYSVGSRQIQIPEKLGLDVILPKSAAKIQRMMYMLELTGYTTFIQ